MGLVSVSCGSWDDHPGCKYPTTCGCPCHAEEQAQARLLPGERMDFKTPTKDESLQGRQRREEKARRASPSKGGAKGRGRPPLGAEARVPVTILLPPAVLQVADELRGDVPRSRFLARLVEKGLPEAERESR